MQISKSFEETKSTIALENMANRLADKVRNIWLDKHNLRIEQWEENFYEDSDGIKFLEKESFPNLIGIDYIFRWWGNDDLDELAGQLDVLWKSEVNGKMTIYKTWIRFANRDFVLGVKRSEDVKREENRAEFRRAFELWQELYMKEISS